MMNTFFSLRSQTGNLLCYTNNGNARPPYRTKVREKRGIFVFVPMRNECILKFLKKWPGIDSYLSPITMETIVYTYKRYEKDRASPSMS